jgi:EmrB/QacA subfamily drug resistance transporter
LKRRTAEPRAVLGVAAFGAVLAFIDATIVNVAFPDIRRDFEDASLSGISWVLNAYNIVFAAFLVAAGRIADLLGRKRLFEAGILFFTGASVLCAAAPSVELLVAARIVQAIGAAIVVPASLALVLQAFDGPERGHAVAMWTAAAALAAGLGPSLGGVLVELDGWRLAFLVNLPVGAVAYVLSRRTLVESRAPGARTFPDLTGALLLALAVSALTLGLIKGDEWGWTNARTLGSFVVAIGVGAIFLRRCMWHRSPMLDLGLFRVRSLAVANALTLVGAAGFYSYVLCNVLFLTTVWEYSVLDAGLAITPGPIVATIIARPATNLADRVGVRVMLCIGGLVWAAGMLYMATSVGVTPDFVGEWLPGMVILGLGAGIAFPVVGAAAVAEVPGGRFATATGLNSISRQLGAVIGVALLVAIVGTPGPAEVADAFDRGWYFAAGCFLVLGVGALVIGSVRPSGAAEPEPERPVRQRPAPIAPRPALTAGPAEAAAPAGPPSAVEFLAGVPMFSGLPAETLERMAARAGAVHVRAGDFLFREGDEAQAVFVLVSGRLDVELGGEHLRTLGPGSVVGELALLADSTRSASILARRDSRLLEVTRTDFDELLRHDPHFTLELVRHMGVQLQRSRGLEAPAPPPRATFCLLPLHPGQPFGEIAVELVRALEAGGRVKRLDGFSTEDPAAEAELLERVEHEHDQVVLVADPGDAWADFCLRHADRVVAVAGDAPVPAWVIEEDALKGCELLVTTGDSEAIGRWLDALEPRGRYRIEHPGALAECTARAARRLAGRSVGLVLSGGGARALSHIGVIEELAASGIEIDRVGGCSMGSFIGAMVAMGMDPDEIDARCYEMWVRQRPLTDYRVPRISLIRGDKVRRLLLENDMKTEIETLTRDYFAVAADMLSGELIVQRRGPLFRAVASSMSLPGLAPPTLEAGPERLLIDGGVLNNLPVDVMATTDEGPVIASDATSRFDLRPPDTTARSSRRGARAKGAGLNEDESRLPAFTESLTRALMLGTSDTEAAALEHAALAIFPDDRGVGMLEFHQIDVMREEGRRATAAALEQAPPELWGA